MRADGMDLFVLQLRLGYEASTTTTKPYAHQTPEQQNADVDAGGEDL